MGVAFYFKRRGLKSLLLPGCLHQSWFSLSEEAQEASPPCQTQCSVLGYDQLDCLLSDQGAGVEPAQRPIQEFKKAHLIKGCFKKNFLLCCAVNIGLPTAMISSLVASVAVRDSILAA